MYFYTGKVPRLFYPLLSMKPTKRKCFKYSMVLFLWKIKLQILKNSIHKQGSKLFHKLNDEIKYLIFAVRRKLHIGKFSELIQKNIMWLFFKLSKIPFESLLPFLPIFSCLFYFPLSFMFPSCLSLFFISCLHLSILFIFPFLSLLFFLSLFLFLSFFFTWLRFLFVFDFFIFCFSFFFPS